MILYSNAEQLMRSIRGSCSDGLTIEFLSGHIFSVVCNFMSGTECHYCCYGLVLCIIVFWKQLIIYVNSTLK